MADDIQNPEKIKEAIKLLDEYIEKFKEFNKVKGEAVSQEEEIAERIKLIDIFKQTAEKRQEQIELLQLNLDEDINASKIKKELLAQEIELHKTLNNIRGEDKRALGPALAANVKAAMESFKDLDKAAQETEGSMDSFSKALLSLGAIGFGVLPSPSEFIKFAFALDASRRQLIPYTKTVQDANATHAEFARVSATLGIPLTKMTENLSKAAAEFRSLNLELPETQANLGALVGQMQQLGVGTGVAQIIESMVTDQGIDKIEDATMAFKALTLQMRELGVLPNELAKDYASLIPRFAMFGSAASMNIAKVSLISKRARVDLGAITGFTDNFSGYGSAAKAAQTINAVFGKPIIRNPAELVSIFYTSGDAGVMNYVQQKLVDAGVDLNPDSPADRAKIVALKSLGFGTEQNVMRLLGDQRFTQGELDKAGTGESKGTAGLSVAEISKKFDDLTRKTLTLSEQFTAVQQNLTLELMKQAGIDIGTFGEIGDELAKAMVLSSETLVQIIPFLDEIKTFFGGIGTVVLDKLKDMNKEAERTGDAAGVVGTISEIGEASLPIAKKVGSQVIDKVINSFPEAIRPEIRSALDLEGPKDTSQVEEKANQKTEPATDGFFEAVDSLKKTIQDFGVMMESNAAPNAAPIKVELHLDRSGTAKIAETTIEYIDKKYAIG